MLCAVADAGSFTAASSRLHLTQSAISQQMAVLERELGVPLLERQARGIKLTDAGELLVRRSRRLLRDLSGLEQEMHELANPPEAVTLGVFSTAGAHLVPRVVSVYRERHPSTTLLVRSCPPDALEAELLDEVIDVGLTWNYDFLARPSGDIHLHHIFDDPLCLLLPRDHPLASRSGPARLSEFAHDPWVVRTHGQPYQHAFEIMCRQVGFEPTVVFRAEDYASAQGLVAAGIGVSVAPRLSLAVQRPDIVTVELIDPTFTRRIDAATHPDVPGTTLARQLLSLLEEVWRVPG